MKHYQFTRLIFGVHWTITVAPSGVTFERGMIPHWHEMQGGLRFWNSYSHFMPGGLKLAAANVRRLRKALSLSPSL